MDLSARHPVLKMKLGNDGFLELRDILDSYEREWRKGVLETATDRFERRLTAEIATVRVSLIRWMFGFFVAYLGVTLSLVGMILRAAK